MKKRIALTKANKEFVLDKMSQGYDISQICSKWGDKLPSKNHIYGKAVTDEDFAADINQAYTVLLMHRLDELHEISGKIASDVYPGVDWREAEAALKRRIDEAKFVLGKMAPILSKRFDRASKVEVKGELDSGNKILVLNYTLEGPAKLPSIDVKP